MKYYINCTYIIRYNVYTCRNLNQIIRIIIWSPKASMIMFDSNDLKSKYREQSSWIKNCKKKTINDSIPVESTGLSNQNWILANFRFAQKKISVCTNFKLVIKCNKCRKIAYHNLLFNKVSNHLIQMIP